MSDEKVSVGKNTFKKSLEKKQNLCKQLEAKIVMKKL